MRRERGITLIALVVTIIVLIILAGISIQLVLGKNGIITKSKEAKKDYEIAEIIEKLEVEKANLITDLTGDLPSVDEYVNYLISKNIINEADVINIDDNTKEIIVDKYVFLIEKEESGNIKITYNGPATNDPRIGKIEIVKTTVGSIKIKVIASKVDGGDYNYYIKNITTGEEYSETPTETSKENEYEFTGLERENRYKIKVELVNSNGKAEKETEEIETVPTKVNSITLNKTSIEVPKGETDTTLTLTIKPDEAEDKSVTWISSNEEVATVEISGNTITITGIELGTANIIVTSNDGTNKSASCKVTVTPPPPPSIGEIGTTHTAKQIPYGWADLEQIAKVISDNYGYEEGQINEDTAEIAVTYRGISTTLGIGDWTTVNGNRVRILGFNHDDLVTTTTNEEGETIPWAQYGTGATNTKAGISFEYVDFIASGKMHTSPTNSGGWGSSNIRKVLNTNSNATITTLENKEQIKQVIKKYIPKFNAPSTKESNDYLWLLSCSEIWDNGYNGGDSRGLAITKEGEGQYKYYKVNMGSLQYNSPTSVTYKPTGSSRLWFLRSPAYESEYSYCCIKEAGSSHYYSAASPTNVGFAPGFAI